MRARNSERHRKGYDPWAGWYHAPEPKAPSSKGEEAGRALEAEVVTGLMGSIGGHGQGWGEGGG